MAEDVKFYGTKGLYGCFSNFYPAGFTLRDRQWPTVEHFFQAMKFEGSEYADAIRTAANPTKAKRLGKSRAHPIRPDWSEVRYPLMLEALRAKFTQHEPLRQVLLSTGSAHLAEHTARDKIWGDGGNGSGQNLLGKALMQVRGELV